eukprot:TRINITY_DN991_c0_g1_i1.p1 TRINITY_DN991_c0_g1~~TRINITY_DN991_c0_g1_i1.p1  ORF type:complete len:178 (+),score=34.40 TRINITY_DN991_c0_g1_i1:236-769(+)
MKKPPGFIIRQKDDSAVITDIHAGSHADILGLQVKDNLTSVNGEFPESFDILMKCLETAELPYKLTFIRPPPEVRWVEVLNAGDSEVNGRYECSGFQCSALMFQRDVYDEKVSRWKIYSIERVEIPKKQIHRWVICQKFQDGMDPKYFYISTKDDTKVVLQDWNATCAKSGSPFIKA